MNRKISDILDGAAALIEERGHAQHALRGEDGGFCLLGAINAAVCGDAVSYALPDGALALIRRANPKAGWDLVDWNNAPERTPAEVCAALRRAADLARADEGAEVAHVALKDCIASFTAAHPGGGE